MEHDWSKDEEYQAIIKKPFIAIISEMGWKPLPVRVDDITMRIIKGIAEDLPDEHPWAKSPDDILKGILSGVSVDADDLIAPPQLN